MSSGENKWGDYQIGIKDNKEPVLDVDFGMANWTGGYIKMIKADGNVSSALTPSQKSRERHK